MYQFPRDINNPAYSTFFYSWEPAYGCVDFARSLLHFLYPILPVFSFLVCVCPSRTFTRVISESFFFRRPVFRDAPPMVFEKFNTRSHYLRGGVGCRVWPPIFPFFFRFLSPSRCLSLYFFRDINLDRFIRDGWARVFGVNTLQTRGNTAGERLPL